MNTRKYPRTMQEAFGPYTSHQLAERPRPYDWQDVVVMAGSIVCALCVAVILWSRA